jgi:MPBQ/MSBQ methyltransferase
LTEQADSRTLCKIDLQAAVSCVTLARAVQMTNSNVEIVNEFYERFMLGGKLDFDKIGFLNLGYWKGVEGSIELAQINLIETLVSFLTKKDRNVLDVACGKGTSSKFLTKYFDPRYITGINISEKQLQICRLVAPECDFKLMDATRLDFSDSSSDNVLCIEAAQHFKTRYKFLEEAYRVLKPGGRLAMSDMVHDRNLLDRLPAEWPIEVWKEVWPEENWWPNLEVYRENLLEIGFKYVRIEDSTEFCVVAIRNFVIKKAEMEFDTKILERVMKAHCHVGLGVTCCMVYAIK